MSKKGGKKVSITVGVLEGRGLGPTNFFGTADTYCVVTVFAAEGEEHKDQTGVQTGTLEPSWAHTASFPSVGKASKLIVSVRNSETHEALGAVTLDKSKLRLKDGTPPKPQQEDWHTLLAEEGMVAAAAGEIKLSLLVGPAGKESKADKAAAKKAAKAAKGAPNLLRVQIVQGRGLRANDTNFLRLRRRRHEGATGGWWLERQKVSFTFLLLFLQHLLLLILFLLLLDLHEGEGGEDDNKDDIDDCRF